LIFLNAGFARPGTVGLPDHPCAGVLTLAARLSKTKGLLTRVFAGVIFVVAGYMLYRNAGAVGLI
jgi:hypothetical protein